MAATDEPLLRFPCDIAIKAMGRNEPEFPALVLEIVRRHIPDVAQDAAVARASRQGTYLAVTVTVRAESREQIDAVYRELTAHEKIAVAL